MKHYNISNSSTSSTPCLKRGNKVLNNLILYSTMVVNTVVKGFVYIIWVKFFSAAAAYRTAPSFIPTTFQKLKYNFYQCII